MGKLLKPNIRQALPLYPRGGEPPVFRMFLTSDEYGMKRGMKKYYMVVPTVKAWNIIEKSLPMRNNNTVTEIVYAWDMLRRNRLICRFEDIIETANTTGRDILDVVCDEINLIKKLAGKW